MGQKIVFTVVFGFWFIYSLTLLYPFVWCLFSAVKTNSEFVMNMFGLPKNWLWEHFITAFDKLRIGNSNMFAMFANSLWFAIGTTLVMLATTTCIAYVSAKYKFFGAKLIYNVNLFVMLFPAMAAGAAGYKFWASLGVINTPFVLLMYIGGWGGNFLILHGFFRGLPWEYAESAYIDGASDFYTFIKVMLPMASAPLSALAVLGFIGGWNDYSTPLIYLSRYPTIMLGIYQFETLMQYAANYPVLFSGILLSTIPVLILFISFQRLFVSSLSVGGLKG
jgi:raffinose/stachyose/melibiose transport system permease protein/N-acetylglucosamine transport system permease protein